jgi:hypothetical protein
MSFVDRHKSLGKRSLSLLLLLQLLWTSEPSWLQFEEAQAQSAYSDSMPLSERLRARFRSWPRYQWRRFNVGYSPGALHRSWAAFVPEQRALLGEVHAAIREALQISDSWQNRTDVTEGGLAVPTSTVRTGSMILEDEGQIRDYMRALRTLQNGERNFRYREYLLNGIPAAPNEVARLSPLTALIELNDFMKRHTQGAEFTELRGDCVRLMGKMDLVSQQLDLFLINKAIEKGVPLASLRLALNERGNIEVKKFGKLLKAAGDKMVYQWFQEQIEYFKEIVLTRSKSSDHLSLEQRRILLERGFFTPEAFVVYSGEARMIFNSSIQFLFAKIVSDALLSGTRLVPEAIPNLLKELTHIGSVIGLTLNLGTFGTLHEISHLVVISTEWGKSAARAQMEWTSRITQKAVTRGAAAVKNGAQAAIGAAEEASSFWKISASSGIPLGTAMFFTDMIFSLYNHPDRENYLLLAKYGHKQDADRYLRRLLTEGFFNRASLGAQLFNFVYFMVVPMVGNYVVLSTMAVIAPEVAASSLGMALGGFGAFVLVLAGSRVIDKYLVQPIRESSHLTGLIDDSYKELIIAINKLIENPQPLLEAMQGMMQETGMDKSQALQRYSEQKGPGAKAQSFDLDFLRALVSGKLSEFMLKLSLDPEKIAALNAEKPLADVLDPFMNSPSYQDFKTLALAIENQHYLFEVGKIKDDEANGNYGFLSSAQLTESLKQHYPQTVRFLEMVVQFRASLAALRENFSAYRSHLTDKPIIGLEMEMMQKKGDLLRPLQNAYEVLNGDAQNGFTVGLAFHILAITDYGLKNSGSIEIDRRKASLKAKDFLAEIPDENKKFYEDFVTQHAALLDFVVEQPVGSTTSLALYQELSNATPIGRDPIELLTKFTATDNNNASTPLTEASNQLKLLVELKHNEKVAQVLKPLDDEYSGRIQALAWKISWRGNGVLKNQRQAIVTDDICRMANSAAFSDPPRDASEEKTDICVGHRFDDYEFIDEVIAMSDDVPFDIGLLDGDDTHDWSRLWTNELAMLWKLSWRDIPAASKNPLIAKTPLSHELANELNFIVSDQLRQQWVAALTYEQKLAWLRAQGLKDVNEPVYKSALTDRLRQAERQVDPLGRVWSEDSDGQSGFNEIMKMFDDKILQETQRALDEKIQNQKQEEEHEK